MWLNLQKNNQKVEKIICILLKSNFPPWVVLIKKFFCLINIYQRNA